MTTPVTPRSAWPPPRSKPRPHRHRAPCSRPDHAPAQSVGWARTGPAAVRWRRWRPTGCCLSMPMWNWRPKPCAAPWRRPTLKKPICSASHRGWCAAAWRSGWCNRSWPACWASASPWRKPTTPTPSGIRSRSVHAVSSQGLLSHRWTSSPGG